MNEIDQISNSDHSVLVHLDSLHKEVELRGGEPLPTGVAGDQVLDVGHRHETLAVNIEDRQALEEFVRRRLVLALADPHHLLELVQSQAGAFKVLGDVRNLERNMAVLCSACWRSEIYLGLEGIFSQTSDCIPYPLLGKLTSPVTEIPVDVLKMRSENPQFFIWSLLYLELRHSS